jgi:hypothetical protein
MRRVELPGADGGGPKEAVVVSYIPLLTGEPGRVLSVGDVEFQRLMAEADRCPSGLADACLWMAEGGGVFPVFVLPQAHAIADHLLTWAENRPGDWFMLCFAQRRGCYVAALFPNLVGSVERFEAAYFANHGEPSRAAGYELLFRPIAAWRGLGGRPQSPRATSNTGRPRPSAGTESSATEAVLRRRPGGPALGAQPAARGAARGRARASPAGVPRLRAWDEVRVPGLSGFVAKSPWWRAARG